MSFNTPQAEQEFLTNFRADIIDLFSRKKGGHISRWTYTGRQRPGHQPSGSKLWTEFLKASKSYYIPDQEIDLIRQSLPRLSAIFKNADTLVDFGSGNRFAFENKAAPMLEACPNIKTYVPVDISEELLEEVAESANTIEPGLKVVPICSDFYKNRPKIIMPGQQRAGIMVGSTISNMNMKEGQSFPSDNIIQKIQQLGTLLKKDNPDSPASLALSWDSNPDLKGSALQAYNDDNWRLMIVSVMIDVQTALKPMGNFDPFAWEYQGVADVQNDVIHQCAVATKAQQFFIGGKGFTIDEGDRFVIVNNFKYRPEVMQDLVRKAGYEPDTVIRVDGNHMAIQTMTIP